MPGAGQRGQPAALNSVRAVNAERKLPPKTELEWDGVLRRFTEAVGADLPVRAISAAHVRSFKAALLGTTGRTGKTLSPATVKKNMGALASVLSWSKREGYLTVNPAEDITVAAGKGDPDDRRLPRLRRLLKRFQA